MKLSLKNTMHASSFRSKLCASLKRFVRAFPVQCQYFIPTVFNLQCHSPTFLRLLPGQWITSIYFPIHGLKPSITRNFPGKLHAVKLFPKSCLTIDLNQMKWYIKGAVSWQYSSFCLILPITRPQSPWNLQLAKKLHVNDKIRDPRQTNLSPEHYFWSCK